MRACTTISKKLIFILLFVLTASTALAQGQGSPAIPGNSGGPPASDPNAPAVPTGAKKEESNLFDESSPYLEYGDFNMNEDENEDALYFQYGRFFGISAGLGYQTALGNRGKLWDAGFPRLDLRIQYWFSFNFAIDMGVFFVNQSYTDNSNNTVQVKMIGYGMHLKYYIDTRDKSAALSFSNPFISVGIGAISKDETSSTSATPNSDSTLSIDLGGGLEFPIVYKKTYFILEGMYHTQNFADSADNTYSARGLNDLSGGFFTLMGHFMFVW